MFRINLKWFKFSFQKKWDLQLMLFCQNSLWKYLFLYLRNILKIGILWKFYYMSFSSILTDHIFAFFILLQISLVRLCNCFLKHFHYIKLLCGQVNSGPEIKLRAPDLGCHVQTAVIVLTMLSMMTCYRHVKFVGLEVLTYSLMVWNWVPVLQMSSSLREI